MEIIGEAGREFYIATIRKDEVANLVGYYWGGDLKKPIEVGDKINIRTIFKQLYEMKGREMALEKLAKELEDLASLLRLQNPVMRSACEGITEEFKRI